MNPVNPVCLIILAKRMNAVEPLMSYLLANHPREILFSYVEFVSPEDVGLLLDLLADDDGQLECFVMSSTIFQTEWRIWCAEKLVQLKKYEIFHRWAKQNPHIFADCPILTTIFAEALIVNNLEVKEILSFKKADFKHLAKASQSLKNDHSRSICLWQLGDYQDALSLLKASNLFLDIPDLIFAEQANSFSAFWSDEITCASLFQTLDMKIIQESLHRRISLEETNFLALLGTFIAGRNISEPLKAAIWSTTGLELHESSILDITIFMAVHDQEGLAKFIKAYADERLISKCVIILKQMELLRPAGFLALDTKDIGQGVDMLLCSGLPLEQVIDIVKEKNNTAGWNVLGRYLLDKQMFSSPWLSECIIKGCLQVEETSFNVILENISFNARLDFVKYLWQSGQQSEASLELVFQNSSANTEDLEWAIGCCENTLLINRLGVICFKSGFFDIAHKAFMKSKSADWTVMSLIELGRLEDVPRFIRLVKNPYVLLYSLEKFLTTSNVGTQHNSIKALVSLLQNDPKSQILLVDLFRKSGNLPLLAPNINVSIWSEESLKFLLRSLIIACIQPDDALSKSKNHVPILVDLDYWDLIKRDSFMDSESALADKTIHNGCCFLSDEILESFIQKGFSLKTISTVRPDLIVRNNLPLEFSYWTSRHSTKNTTSFHLDGKEVVNHEDYAIMKTMLESGQLPLESVDMQTIDAPMKMMFTRYHLARRNFPDAVQLLLDMNEFLSAIDLAIKSHSKDVCKLILTHFKRDKNHTMLFVSSMAFHGIVKDDVIIEYAWKSGVYSKFVPFICQYVYEQN